MIITRHMTARRTEQFLKELQFNLDSIQRGMITAYAKDGEIVPLTDTVAIRQDYKKDAKLPSEAYYIVEIFTAYDDFSPSF